MRGFLKAALSVLAAVMVLATSGCGTKSIVIGIESNSLPLSGRTSDDKPTGFVVEMAREAGKRMGVEVSFKFVAIDDKAKNYPSSEFAENGVNAIWSKLLPDAKSNQDTDSMLFTKSYMTDRQVLLVESSSRIEKISGLGRKKVGAVKGSLAESALLKSAVISGIKNKKPVPYNELVTAFIKLDGLKVDAIAVDESYARYRMKEHSEQYRILGGTLAREEYRIAVRRNDSSLRDSFETALDAMKADGTSATISKKWFGVDLT